MNLSRGDLVLAAVAGASIGVGLWLVAADTGVLWHQLRVRLAGTVGGLSRSERAVRVGGIVAAALVVGVLTGWPAAAVLAAAAAAALPGLFAAGRTEREITARVEAVAGWAEMLRDTLAAAAGIEQAIIATAAIAPLPIRNEVLGLAADVQTATPLPDALARFADRVADPTADLVVAALVLAATRQARHLGDLLGRLAAAARDQAAVRLRTAAARAQIRTSVRVITVTTTGMTAGLVLLSPAFVSPYSTVAGQLVLLAVGGVFAVAFGWLARIARLPSPPRILTRLPTGTRS